MPLDLILFYKKYKEQRNTLNTTMGEQSPKLGMWKIQQDKVSSTNKWKEKTEEGGMAPD